MKPTSSSTATTAPANNKMPKTTRRNINVFSHAYGLRQAAIMREKLLALSPADAVALMVEMDD